MKQLLNLVVCLFMGLAAMAQLPELTVEQHLEDYDFAVKYLEDNYAGFPNKVVDSTRADYEAMKTRLRDQVASSERTSWSAIAEYTGWFNDYHTRLCFNDISSDGRVRGATDRYRTRNRIYYDELMEVYQPTAVACKVTDKTFLIRFPSCYGEPDMDWIEGSIQAFKESGCENLVLDIRGNSGGSDNFFKPYWKLLYDHEGIDRGIEYRNTPEHRRLLLQQFKDEGLPEEVAMSIQAMFPMIANIPYLPYTFLSKFQDMMTGSQDLSMQGLMGMLGDLESSDGDGCTLTYRCDQVDDAVRKAALIIDNFVASSGEQMVREIRLTSDRTVIYGRDNTLGCLDFSNIYEAELPNSHIHFTSPMSRSMGLPETGVDDTGIAPDVRIDLPLPAKLTDNIDEWVIWVAEQLEK